MGLAQPRVLREVTVEVALEDQPRILGAQLEGVENRFARLADEALAELERQGHARLAARLERRAFLKYEGTDVALELPWGAAGGVHSEAPSDALRQAFERAHRERYGFVVEGKRLVVETLQVEAVGGEAAVGGGAAVGGEPPVAAPPPTREAPLTPRTTVPRLHARAPGARRHSTSATTFASETSLTGPAIVVEATGTDVVEPGWRAELIADGSLLLCAQRATPTRPRAGPPATPSSSKSSTTASCRSPSRWAPRWPTRPRR